MSDSPLPQVVPPPLKLSPEAAALKPKLPQPPAADVQPPVSVPAAVQETGGPKGPEPTRFGDWEKKGRCSDF